MESPEFLRARTQALKILARGPRSSGWVAAKLAEKGADAQTVQRVINTLKESVSHAAVRGVARKMRIYVFHVFLTVFLRPQCHS